MSLALVWWTHTGRITIIVSEQLEKARQLIINKRFNEARIILTQVDHKTAKRWLAKLDEIAPETPPNADFIPAMSVVEIDNHQKTHKKIKHLLVELFCIFVWVSAGVVGYRYRENMMEQGTCTIPGQLGRIWLKLSTLPILEVVGLDKEWAEVQISRSDWAGLFVDDVHQVASGADYDETFNKPISYEQNPHGIPCSSYYRASFLHLLFGDS